MDDARAAAAALRRPPAAARERYPEWVAVRTERRKPRRVGAGTKVDADDHSLTKPVVVCFFS